MLNIVFLAMGCIFLVLLSIVFLSKEIRNTKENKCFKLLLLFNGVQYLAELPLQIFTRTFGIEAPIVDVFLRFYLIAIVFYMTIFSIYTFIIGLNLDNSEKKENVLKRVLIIHISVIIFNVFGFSILPAYKYHDANIMYAYGPAVDALKLILGLYMVIWLVILLTNIKYLKNKKFLPIFLVLVLGIANGLIQSFDPSVLITTVVDTLICYSMFFTIENPDIKMIQELQVAREQADKANRAKTDFLSSMSHEIRTPLNAIVGFSDCIMDANDLTEAKENAKDIVNASQTLLEIVNGILDISKIEAGKIEIINTKYNAPETFLELAKLITPKMKEKGLDFTYNIATDLPLTLFGDHANIKKIVTNLLSNACKYTDRGYVHYEVNCVNSRDVTKLIISVEDSGRGIKKESIDKMFTKFQRLDEDRNTTIEGTGLGLAITKQLIELMGGRIIVHTVYGEGSKFTVVLNQKIEKEDVVKTKRVKSTLDLHDVRILLVDDTALNLKVASKLLEKFNANHIVTCNSGFECYERISKGEVYDLILLDDMMPKMSGVETLKKLKELEGFNIPTVALTANAISGMREKYLRDGFDDYLAKPIEKEQLILVVNQILGRSLTEDILLPSNQLGVGPMNPSIRGEEVFDVSNYDKAEEERKNKIIPVEDNIEEVLGSKLDRCYKPEEISLNPTPIEVNHIDEIETLEEESESTNDISTIKPVDLVPVVDINPINNNSKNSSNEVVYDRSYLENNGVDVNHALELLGDMEMYNMTIVDFMSEVEKKWADIVKYKEENNMPEYAILVHSLKSDCKYLGFMSLADISYQHELKSKENDSNFVNEHFSELEEEYLKILKIAKEYVNHIN